MKKATTALMLALTVICSMLFFSKTAYAAPDHTIREGVSAGDIDLSGMTQEEASQAIEEYVESLQDKQLSLQAADGESVILTAREMGLVWENTDLVKEAVGLGKKGNVVVRYKAVQDLKYKGRNFPIVLNFDKNAILNKVREKCTHFNVEAVDARLIRTGNGFEVESGQTGYLVDEAASANRIYDYMMQQWDREDGAVELVMAVDEPKGKAEELRMVKDVLGTFTTQYASPASDRGKNVSNGCSLINGTTLYPGETFSTYETVRPFSAENGYYFAGSYLNGQVVDSIGGGICQVSTTLYNAVLRAELEVTERHNHSMIVNYVDPSADAAIAESAGKDFRFVNNLDYPIYIDGHTEGGKITFTIYGVETRGTEHGVFFESEVLEKKVPEQDRIVADPGQPVGFIHVSSEHIGYRAELWKIVKENGVEVSRERVNKSNYQPSPRTATVGTATQDPNVANMLNAAMATNDISVVKSTLANIKAAMEAAAAMTPEQLAEIAAAQQAAQEAEAGE